METSYGATSAREVDARVEDFQSSSSSVSGAWAGLGRAVSLTLAVGACVAVAGAVGGRAPASAVEPSPLALEELGAARQSQSQSQGSSSQAPNIVLVTIDDAGWNDVGWTSSDMPQATPRIARMAARGVTLTQYYGQPSCSPSRAAMLSGVWVHRIGFQDTEIMAHSNFSIPLSRTLLPARLAARGYATHGLGKWNVGHCAEEYLPWNRGFDTFEVSRPAANQRPGSFDYEHTSYIRLTVVRPAQTQTAARFPTPPPPLPPPPSSPEAWSESRGHTAHRPRTPPPCLITTALDSRSSRLACAALVCTNETCQGYMTSSINYRTRSAGNFTWQKSTYPLYDQLRGNSSGAWAVDRDALDDQYDTFLYRDKAIALVERWAAPADAPESSSQSSESNLPLFLWLAFHGVHADVEGDNVADAELATENVAALGRMAAAGASDGRLAYARALMALDGAVGALEDALVRVGALPNNTVLLVHSDNGAMPCTYKADGRSKDMPGSNFPLRSAKFQCVRLVVCLRLTRRRSFVAPPWVAHAR